MCIPVQNCTQDTLSHIQLTQWVSSSAGVSVWPDEKWEAFLKIISATEFPRAILLQVFSVCPPPVCMGAPVLEVSLCQISPCLPVWKDCGSCYCPLIHAYQELLSSGDRDLEQLFSSFFSFSFPSFFALFSWPSADNHTWNLILLGFIARVPIYTPFSCRSFKSFLL